jgi:hypothetical protein
MLTAVRLAPARESSTPINRKGLILDHGGSVMSVVKSMRQRHVKKADTRSELREDDDEGAH